MQITSLQFDERKFLPLIGEILGLLKKGMMRKFKVSPDNFRPKKALSDHSGGLRLAHVVLISLVPSV
jgi:hypothetical protein